MAGRVVLVVLERLSPAERTAFLLHDVFGMAFDEVSGVVGRSPAAVRQLAAHTGHFCPLYEEHPPTRWCFREDFFPDEDFV